jgi:putative membrane protein
MNKQIFLYLKGVAMGAADVVPGVSGGTIAFISGIYETLLNALRSFDGRLLGMVIKGKWSAAWNKINGTFLLVLLSGIGTSILALSKLMLYLLEFHPVPTWSFFLGLILASIVGVCRDLDLRNLRFWIGFVVGTVLAYIITVMSPTQTPEALWFIFVSGAIAICAMILPGISGSFILLLMGKYRFILQALHDLNIPVIVVFIMGTAIGLLSFSHVLSWLLRRHHLSAVSLLAGFMLGSLNKVWPWKQTLTSYTDSKGDSHSLTERNLMPGDYEALTGNPSQWGLAIALMAFGAILILGLESWGRLLSQNANPKEDSPGSVTLS